MAAGPPWVIIMAYRIRILVVGGSSLFRRVTAGFLRSCEEIESVEESADAGEACDMARKIRPDVVVLIQTTAGDATSLASAIRAAVPTTRFAVIGGLAGPDDILHGLKVGIQGWVNEDGEPADLLATVRIVGRGGFALSSSKYFKLFPILAAEKAPLERVEPPVLEPNSNPSDKSFSDLGLSTREIEVLTLLAEGATNKEISEVLHITESTTKTHVRNILEKLQLRSRTQAALYAFEQGLRLVGRDAKGSTD